MVPYSMFAVLLSVVQRKHALVRSATASIRQGDEVMRIPMTSTAPAISFRYGGRSSDEILPQWEAEESAAAGPNGVLVRRIITDPVTRLKVTVTVQQFDDCPAVDWVVQMENCGSTVTPIIEDILPLDLSVPVPAGERLRLHHANGSRCRMDDFLPLVTDLAAGSGTRLAPVGGRSSNGVFPFVNLQRDGGGFVLGVGWSGQWSMTLDRGSDSLRLTAGMATTHLALRPGETVRTPRILLLPWDGDDDSAGTNALRQLLIAHYLPRIDGELVFPPAAQVLQAHYYLTGKACEQFEMTALPRAAEAGVEAHWIDACWYGEGTGWWTEVGSWVVNRDKFPRGLKPISDAAHAAGMKFILWFEPERVRTGSIIHREHPEWLLRIDDSDSLLLNLGIPEARRHIADLISGLIAENGVDVYRQDFNMEPLRYWQAADEPDRVGMTEIRHVEGLYEFWDEIRRRHPKLWIDNCSSGGRRIDLETLSRSLPLWPSDFPDVCGLPFGFGLHVGDQCINAGLARWIPLFGGGVWNFTPYGTRGEIIGGFGFGMHIEHDDFLPDGVDTVVPRNEVLAKGKTMLDADFPLDAARQAFAERRSIRPFCLGDFYLLLPLTVSYHDWCAWQLHREDLQAGIAVFFRRHRSPFPAMRVELACIDRDAEYEVSLSPGYEEGPRERMDGRQLAELLVKVPEMPGSVLLRYARLAF